MSISLIDNLSVCADACECDAECAGESESRLSVPKP